MTNNQSSQSAAPPSIRQAVILAGGQGTRLAPFNTVLPKPLMPLGQYSILEIVLRQLADQGFNEIILATGYLSEIIEAFVSSLAPRLGMQIRVQRETTPLGTIAPLAQISGLAENFLVMNGDILTDLSFAQLLQEQQDHSALATLAVGPREVKIDFGILKVDTEGQLARFSEKPVLAHLVSLGVYAFRRDVVDWIPAGERFDLPDLLHLLLESNRVVRTHRYEGYWKDIGRWEDYETAKTDFEQAPERFLPKSFLEKPL